ncbi:MAG TPA: tetratricopeptide repeat protein [Desulfobacterales bacterium]|nr:tetratricopeptide repeat protein [Desulfobacterales bacterium]
MGQSISLCMIVRNEEQNLKECLESIHYLVDEIIVVDTGSEDRTPQIARDFGAKIYSFKWINDFAAARNESIRHATGDYILWLDADDRIPPQEREKFIRWKQELPTSEKQAYWFIVESPKEEEFLTERCYQLRVFPRVEGVRFIRRVHESILESVKALGIPSSYCDVIIQHVGYARKEDMHRKANRNLRLLLTALAEAPNDPTIHWHLSMTYNVIGEKEKSAYHAETLVSLISNNELKGEERQWQIAAMVHLGNLYADLGRDGEAERILRRAVKLDPDNPIACFFLAKLLMKRRAYSEALPVLSRLKKIKTTVHQVPYPQRAVKFYCHLWLGNCYEALGKRDKAVREYALASEINPNWAERGAEIGEFYLRRGEGEKALQVLERAAHEDPFNPSVLSNLALAYKRLGRIDEAEVCLRKAVQLDPEHFDALANLGHLLLLQGKLEEATSPLRKAALIRMDADLAAALILIAILQGRIEDALPYTERLMEAMGEKTKRTLDTLGDYALLLEELAMGLMSKGHLYEAYLLNIASRHLLQQEAILSSVD